jgi:hypothetical protein
MNTKHTPGPWYVGDLAAPDLAGRNMLVYASSGYAVADAKIFHCMFGVPEMEANARLIAAAPDLLEALQHLMLDLEYHGLAGFYSETSGSGLGGAVADARAAIAKATEKAP